MLLTSLRCGCKCENLDLETICFLFMERMCSEEDAT